MRKFYLFILLLISGYTLMAQNLPVGFAEGEKQLMPAYLENVVSKGETTPPDFPVRSAAEWEEMQGVVISWQSYSNVLTEIVRYSVEQGKVYIVTQSGSYVETQLNNAGVATDSVVFVNEPSNTVWIRDYGPNNVYANNVDSLLFVDWIYNRPRPYDDDIPVALADLMNVPLYQTTNSPYDMVGTGGNFMSDGFGMGFSSELIVDENSGHSVQEIEDIMQSFMGIDEYVLMETLPYDGIHHIDMHMKLLDEETLLVGEYPEGVADGPQIEANLQYVLDNYQSVFGTPFKVVRIPMPPDAYGDYPDDWGDYRTYTNSLILNKLVLVPIYGANEDDEALEIYRENMPGYTVVGIDCNATIPASGAIHCISHELGAKEPLLISHQPITSNTADNLGHEVTAYLEHTAGIAEANVMFRVDSTADFSMISMTQDVDSSELWHGHLPLGNKSDSIEVQYYIRAVAENGKTQVRPITAPEGFWSYKVGEGTNVLPFANAGQDQTVDALSTVTLDGTASSDANGDELTYEWYTNADISFDDATLAQPTFIAPDVAEDTTLRIFLKVSDGVGESVPDTVLVHVNYGVSAAEQKQPENWKVFPNPATSHLYFAFAEVAPKLVRIVNASGAVVLNEVPVDDFRSFKLNTSHFTEGLYLIQAVWEDKVSTKRIIIK